MGVQQTAAYMDTWQAEEGHPAVFDRRNGASWGGKVFPAQRGVLGASSNRFGHVGTAPTIPFPGSARCSIRTMDSVVICAFHAVGPILLSEAGPPPLTEKNP